MILFKFKITTTTKINHLNDRTSQSRCRIIIWFLKKWIHTKQTSGSMFCHHPQNSEARHRAGESPPPPLPYLGRRAGSVRNAIIASLRRQLHDNKACSEDLGRSHYFLFFKNKFVNTKSTHSVCCDITLRKLTLLSLRLMYLCSAWFLPCDAFFFPQTKVIGLSPVASWQCSSANVIAASSDKRESSPPLLRAPDG